MTHPELDDLSEYVKDILNLTAYLDVSAADGRESIRRVLARGKELYFGLVFRRLSLSFSPEEGAVILWMLDLVQARLALLERLRHQALRKSGAGTLLRRSRHTGSWA